MPFQKKSIFIPIITFWNYEWSILLDNPFKMGFLRIFINDRIIRNYLNNTNKIHSILIFFQYHIQIECTKVWIAMILNRTVQTLTILSAVVVCFGGKDWSLDEHPHKWNDYSKEKIDQMLKRKLNENLGNLHFRLQTQVANTGCNYVKYYKC